MLPHDTQPFTANSSAKWLRADERWFSALTSCIGLTVVEKVHLARVALQQQWVCDVIDSRVNRQAIQSLGLHVAATEGDYLVVSGSGVIQEYLRFRGEALSAIETGVLYGYPASAVLAFTGVVSPKSPQPLPQNCADYYLGGAYSRDKTAEERSYFANHWADLELHAPELCRLAEIEFETVCSLRAA